ncbi:hypothetical protein [Prosthecobacter sp.]|uniref:hypothetical protein n=1 Tax=Prosthecobacter sp. TaxID=1965333 RepID=UPI002AB88128|nr:hypothetical protein [Prosthecobacter sp.]MDZ4403902.1 hypothetical protein [Prosthecobacter sp.]
MTNSPGGIQAGRDVVINSDKHLIHSLSLHVAVAADTLPAEPSGPRIAAGLGSFIALFSADKTRIRFKTDFTLSHQQVGRTRRRVEFIYTPETPDQILGKEIDFLGQIELLVVNYSEIFDTLKFNTKNKNAQLQCLVFLNGVKIATFSTGEEFEGTLNVGQINLSVTEAFAPIPSAYAGLISNR